MNGAELDPFRDGGLYEDSDYMKRMRVARTIEQEEGYPSDAIWQEDYMLERLTDLIEENGIDPIQADETFNDWYRLRHPDTRVIYLGEVAVPKPFVE